jgi:hypothetical protein
LADYGTQNNKKEYTAQNIVKGAVIKIPNNDEKWVSKNKTVVITNKNYMSSTISSNNKEIKEFRD